MKKGGIITHYNVHNHGAILQLYALSKELRELGYEAKALQFRKNYDFMDSVNSEKKYSISLQSVPYYIKYALKNGIKRTLFNYLKRKTLYRFKKDNCLIGEYYSKANDLDVVVIGSDEIFSIEAGPNPWFYGIGVPCKKQISYAASFGPTTIEAIEAHNVWGLVSGGLNSIKFISVRDENSAEIVEKITNKRPVIVCDPVILYRKMYEESKISNSAKQPNCEYCIVYSYDDNCNTPEEINSIKKYAKTHNLKVFSIGYYHKWCDKNIIGKPLDLFALFSNSKMVFTDTFHGTVLSIVTHSQFVCKLRNNSNKLLFLLKQFGVESNCVETFEDISRVNTIDYCSLEKRVETIREESIRFLKNALEKRQDE